ncbi:MAG: ferredoxin [Euryarchaeota archaeon]|nr:ferredoxin [Euryarchaeota archaeon]
MKIYIDEEKFTGCRAYKPACPEGPRINSIEKTANRFFVKDLSYCLACRMCEGSEWQTRLSLKSDFKKCIQD